MGLINIAIALVAFAGIVHLAGAASSLTPSRVLLGSGVLYALPFVASGAQVVVRYDKGIPVIRHLRYSGGVSLVVLIVLTTLVVNAATDTAVRSAVPLGFARALGSRLLLVYGVLLLASASSLASLITTDKLTRINQLPVAFIFLQLVGIALAGVAIGLGRRAGGLILLGGAFAVLLDLYLGYRLVFVLAVVGGVLIRLAAGGRVAPVVIAIVIAGTFAGIVLKPVYYRIVGGRSVAVSELGAYAREGVAGFESIVTAGVSQVSIEDRRFYSLPSSVDLVPVAVPLTGSLLGEPPSFAETVRKTSFPSTPWGLGGSAIAELYIRDGLVGIFAGVTGLVALSRWRPRSGRLATVWLLACPHAMFFFWRSDLAVTLESTSKSVLILGLCCIGLSDRPSEHSRAARQPVGDNQSVARDYEYGGAG